MAKSNFIVRGGADFSGIKNEIDKTQNQFKKFQLNLNSGLKAIGKMAGITLGAKALVDLGKAAIKTSSDLEEIQNVTDTVFGSMAKDVDEFSKTLIESHGIGELSAKKYASYMGAMLKSSGISGQAMKQMSKDLTLLTADMASFYNLETEEMFQKLMSGMSGATMPLKKLGINMNIAALEAFAMSQGIEKSWREMSQAEQVMLRYQYLMSVTGDAQGDFARNSWNWAHSVKILGEKWKEFLGIVGKGLQAVVLPLVKALIKVLDILIKIATAIEKVFVMLTGKKVDVEPRQVGIVDDYIDTIGDMGDFSEDAAKKQKELGKGIKNAAKAAKGALAPFDELNILQQNLAGGGSGTGGVGGLGDIGKISDEINNAFKVEPVTDSIFTNLEDDFDRFYIGFMGKWDRLREAVAIPIAVAEPVFPTLPVPIFEPEWGLDIPRIPSPIFPPIPSPVYRPNWGLDTPKVPAPVFPKIPVPVYEPVWNLVPPPVPAVDYTEYSLSLENMKIRTAEIFEGIKINIENAVEGIKTSAVTGFEKMKQGALEHTERLRQGQSELWERVRTDTETVTGKIQTGLSGAWSTIETNFNTHKENVGTIATGIATTLVANINTGLSTMGKNFNTTITTVQTNLQTFGKNVANVAAEIAKGFANNLSEGFKTASSNFSTFANTVGENLKAFGEGFLEVAAETAKGFVSNMVSGFATVWSNFKSLMRAIGERVHSTFSKDKSFLVKTAITAGVIVGAGALALAAPTAIPYVAGALGGLAAVPALAKGGITDGPMYALIGDNPGGKEVVSPLDTLEDMLVSAVGTAMMEVIQFSNTSESNKEIIIELDGTRLGRAILPELNKESERLGYKSILQVE